MASAARSVLSLELPGTQEFRASVVAWLEAHLTPDLIGISARGDAAESERLKRLAEWERELGAAGWVGLSWPKKYGGREATLAEQAVFEQEYARSGAPERISGFGEHMLGPLLIARGTDEQQARFLPGVLTGETVWCQGFSEPDSGSDLASVACRAELRGGEWSITGAKLWTSGAQSSQWVMVLARTGGASESRHAGLGFFLVPLDQPGIEVRPVREMSGGNHVNAVFFDDARTGTDCIVGGPGDGWAMANLLLTFERGTTVLNLLWRFEHQFEHMVSSARNAGQLEDPLVRQAIAASWARLRVIGIHAESIVSAAIKGDSPGVGSSLTKVLWSEWHQDFTELEANLRGPAGLIRPSFGDTGYETDEPQHEMLFSRAETIYAGSSQIQRNIISERVLGLPRR